MSRSNNGSSFSDTSLLKVDLPPRPRKQPRQTRSVVLVQALKKAGQEIIEQQGREALMPLSLAEHAGVAVSSIYEYFPTLDALVAAIFDDLRAEVGRAMIAAIHALPPQATLLDGLLLMMRMILSVRQRFARIDPALHLRYTHQDELARLDLVKNRQQSPDSVTAVLLQRFCPDVPADRREKMQFLFFHSLQASLRAMVLERPQYLADGDTALVLARMLHAVLDQG